MQRRMFLGGLSAVALSQNRIAVALSRVAAESVLPIVVASNPVPLPSISLTLKFETSYVGETTLVWTETQKDKLAAAAQLVASVWSSQGFQDAVTAIPSLIYQNKKTIAGTDLYNLLTAHPAKTMNLSVNDRHKECARTNPGTDETLIHLGYLDDPGTAIADLVNTLSHESTHYNLSGNSWDKGHSSDLRAYVSYGIGCLTQNLSGQGKVCDYDPSHSSEEKSHSKPKWPEHTY
jgi:hypothetical protein